MQTSFKQAKIDQARIIKALESLPDFHRKAYSEFEDRMILKYVPLKGSTAVAKILGKTKGQVANRYARLKDRGSQTQHPGSDFSSSHPKNNAIFCKRK